MLNLFSKMWQFSPKITHGGVITMLIGAILVLLLVNYDLKVKLDEERSRWIDYIRTVEERHLRSLEVEREIRDNYENFIKELRDNNSQLSHEFSSTYEQYRRQLEEILSLEETLHEQEEQNMELMSRIEMARCDMQAIDPAFHDMVDDRLQFIYQD